MNKTIEIKYCSKCIHFNEAELNCYAFPSSIPKEILSGKVKHKSKFPEQEGNDVFEDRIEFLKAGGINTTYEEYPEDILYIAGSIT